MIEGCDLALILERARLRGWTRVCGDISIKSCEAMDGFFVVSLEACNNEVVEFIPRGTSKFEIVNESIVESLITGNIPGVTVKCAQRPPLRVVGVELISVNERGLLAKVVFDGHELFLKLNNFVEPDNLEHMMLTYLNSSGLKWAPSLKCFITWRGSLLALLTEPHGLKPLARTVIEGFTLYYKGRGLDLSILTRIAEVVASLHDAMYNCREEWCRPERAGPHRVEKWFRRVMRRADMLRRMASGDDKMLLLEASDSMVELLDLFKGVRDLLEERIVMRIHGDLHLYQFYEDADGLILTDFEGEPYKLYASKDEKEPPERDLASLLRSIDYAAIIAKAEAKGINIAEASQLGEADVIKLEEAEFLSKFLGTYMNKVSSPLYHGLNNDDFKTLLSYWLLERASYEAVYELIASTGFHPIPLNAIIRMKEGKHPLFKGPR